MLLPPDPRWPRYSGRALPPYRFVPGQNPHPRRDPLGHSYGRSEPKPAPCSPDQWLECGEYLYGVDLYNYAYWWECHEVFEGLWHAVGRRTTPGQFFRAIIQVAAANLKRAIGAARPAQNLSRSGLGRLATLPPVYMGLDIVAFAEALRESFAAAHGTPPLLRLDVCATE
jgi:hypothetical protein